MSFVSSQPAKQKASPSSIVPVIYTTGSPKSEAERNEVRGASEQTLSRLLNKVTCKLVSYFSVRSLWSSVFCGESLFGFLHHRDTEDHRDRTENSQRKLKQGYYPC